MAQWFSLLVLVALLLSLRLKSSWAQSTPDDFPVRKCFVGDGRGYTCIDALSDIQCPSGDYCEWRYRRSDQPGSKVIGSLLDLDETSEYGEYYLENIGKNVTEGLVFVMPLTGQFTCGVDCVGATRCDNGQQQTELHLILNVHHDIVKSDTCHLFLKGFLRTCHIGTQHCLVNATNSSDDYYMIICTINPQRVTSYRIYLNATYPSCTVFTKEATGPDITCQGSDAILKCKVMNSANQTTLPAVWWIGGHMVENSDKHSITYNGTTHLTVHNVSMEDDGAQYTCSDAEGKISSSAFLTVTGPPTSNITSIDHCLAGLAISWASSSVDLTSCGPVLYNVTVFHHDRVIQSVTVINTSSTFTGLVPSTNYTITVHSINNAGYSASTITATTTGHITNIRSTDNTNSIFISWDKITTNPNCEEEKNLYYSVSLLYSNGTNLETKNTTLNYVPFENLESNTNYVITVAVASTTGVTSPIQSIDVTTANSGNEGSTDTWPMILVITVGVLVFFIIAALIVMWGVWHRRKHHKTSKLNTDDNSTEEETGYRAMVTYSGGNVVETDGGTRCQQRQNIRQFPPVIHAHPGPVFVLYTVDDVYARKVHEFTDVIRTCGVNADTDLYYETENIASWPEWVLQKLEECINNNGFVILLWSETMKAILTRKDANDNSPVKMAHAEVDRLSILSLIQDHIQHFVVVCLDSVMSKDQIRTTLPSNLSKGTIHNIPLHNIPGDITVEEALEQEQFSELRTLIATLGRQQQFVKPDRQVPGRPYSRMSVSLSYSDDVFLATNRNTFNQLDKMDTSIALPVYKEHN